MFREPEKRPPALVSTAFTVLCVVPFVGLILAWMKLGANISHFPFGLSSIVFHLGLGSIFVLYFCFWLQLNMFTSLKYLIMIGVVTFLCGNSLLVKIAEKRKNSAQLFICLHLCTVNTVLVVALKLQPHLISSRSDFT